MVEIKFLKELPVRLLNKSQVVTLDGADIYVDKDANRFAYFGFTNHNSSPMYSLYFVIKQYDSFGSFIRETKFSLPSIFAPKGKYITEKPVRISDECEGVEVYISYVEFSRKQLYQDGIVMKSYLSEFTKDFYAGVPQTVSCSINSSMVVNQAPAQQASVTSQPVKEEPKKTFEQPTSSLEEPVKEAAPTSVVSEATPVEEEPKEPRKANMFVSRKFMSFGNFVLLGIAAVCFAVLAIVLNAIL